MSDVPDRASTPPDRTTAQAEEQAVADDAVIAPDEHSTPLKVITDPWVRLGILLAIVAAVVAWSLQGEGITVNGLRDQVDGLGGAAPAAYIGLYAVSTTFLVPAAPFTVAAGLLFGPVPGTVIALAGATLGATGAFALGRLLGRDAARQLGGKQVSRIDGFLRDRGFAAVLVLRLVPLFPYNVINVTAGVTALRVRDYVAATAIGIIPGTVVYVALGGTITAPTSPTFLGAVAAFALLTVGAGFAARRMRAQEPQLDVEGDVGTDPDDLAA